MANSFFPTNGRETFVREMHPEKAPSSISVTYPGTIRSVTDLFFTPVMMHVVAVEVKVNDSNSSLTSYFAIKKRLSVPNVKPYIYPVVKRLSFSSYQPRKL